MKRIRVKVIRGRHGQLDLVNAEDGTYLEGLSRVEITSGRPSVLTVQFIEFESEIAALQDRLP